MTSEEYDIRVVIWLNNGDKPITRNDFETMCEARAWLKEITPDLVDLVENKLLTGFTSQFFVRRRGVEPAEDDDGA